MVDQPQQRAPGNCVLADLVQYLLGGLGVDWRIETSQSSIDAWKSGLSSSYYAPNVFGSITGKPAVP